MSEGLVCEDIVSDGTRILIIFHHRAEIGVPKSPFLWGYKGIYGSRIYDGIFQRLRQRYINGISTVYQVISHNKWRGRLRVEIS